MHLILAHVFFYICKDFSLGISAQQPLVLKLRIKENDKMKYYNIQVENMEEK